MYIYPGLVYDIKPATSEMELVIAKDKFLREEIFILAVSKKFTLIRFSLPLYHISSHFSLMSLSSRQDEVAKKVKEKMLTIGKRMMKKKKEMTVIEED